MNQSQKEIELLSLKENTSKSTNDGIHFYQRRRTHNFIFLFTGCFIISMMRSNLSIAIIKMIKTYNMTLENGTQIEIQDFTWGTIEKGYIFSSYYYGYGSAQFIGGWLAPRFGPVLLIGIAIGIPSVINLVTPYLTNYGIIILIITRVVDGFLTGPVIPSTFALWSRWAPEFERSWLSSGSLSGIELGVTFMMLIGAFINEYLGWSWNFYIPAILGLIWTPLWFYFVSNSPEMDRFITHKEKEFIKIHVGEVAHGKDIKHPWKSIFSSKPVWAIWVCSINLLTTIVIVQTIAPTFMNDILKFDIKSSGIVSALPAITLWFSAFISSKFSDFLISKKRLSLVNIRRIFICSCSILIAILFILIIYLKNPNAIIICLCCIKFLQGVTMVNLLPNFLDIAPPHASILYGIGSSFSFALAITELIVIGYIVTDKLLSQWTSIFIFLSINHFFGSLFYLKFSSAKFQPWISKAN